MILHVYCNIERNHRILRHKSNSFGPKSSRNNLCVATCPSICIITRYNAITRLARKHPTFGRKKRDEKLGRKLAGVYRTNR